MTETGRAGGSITPAEARQVFRLACGRHIAPPIQARARTLLNTIPLDPDTPVFEALLDEFDARFASDIEYVLEQLVKLRTQK